MNESAVEDVTTKQLADIGAQVRRGVEIDDAGERMDSGQCVLQGRLSAALHRLNPAMSHEVIEGVVRTLAHPPHPTLVQNNRWLHRLLTDGVEVEYRDSQIGPDENRLRGGRCRLIDFEDPLANDLLVVRQLAVTGPSGKLIRLDLVVFLNGLPIAVIELKDPTDPQADLTAAIEQLDRYQATVPDIFVANLVRVVSDGMITRVGSITSDRSRFMPWRPLADEGEVNYVVNADRKGTDPDERIRVRLESLVGAPERLERLAAFIVEHWEKRRAAMEGKAMVVTMSRDIAARLYEQIRLLRPAWHDADDERGAMKVVVTGGADDPEPLRGHVRTKAARKRLAERFKAPADDLRLVIVCDMWLTGFDCPPAHTLYLDKPLAGHNLMQAIARVNRVWGDKPGGLIVDLLGLADQLADALATYSRAGGTGQAVRQVQDEAVPAMQSAFEKLRDFFHGCDDPQTAGGRQQWSEKPRAAAGYRCRGAAGNRRRGGCGRGDRLVRCGRPRRGAAGHPER